MRRLLPAEWTLGQLGELVARALAVEYPGPSNGQVRAIPDARTIRYYSSLGLLDRAAASRGRTALYGRRHLLQLVAIKRLQAEGASLHAVQERLLGLEDSELESLARLPHDLELAAPGEAPSASQPVCRRSFWRELPAASATMAEPAEILGAQPVVAGSAGAPSSPAPGLLMLLPLEGGVSLLVPARDLSTDQLRRIQAAAGPLLDELRRKG